MLLSAALIEFSYAKDHSPASRRWYHSRLGAFIAWTQEQGVKDMAGITAPLIRRYLDTRRTNPSRTGRPLDSHTLHGHARAIRAFVRWAVKEDLGVNPVEVVVSEYRPKE